MAICHILQTVLTIPVSILAIQNTVGYQFSIYKNLSD